MIREVKVVTTRLRAGVRPDDGHGLQRDHAVGHQHASRARAATACSASRWSAFPFFTPGRAHRRAKPPTDVNVYTVDLGGPIVKDKTHFFGGYEHTERDLSGLSVITITPANQALLGLDRAGLHAARPQHRVRDRQGRSPAQRRQPPVGALHVLRQLHHRQRRRRPRRRSSAPPTSPIASTRPAAQLISTIGANMLNELRVQYATRAQSRVPNALAGHRPGDQHHRRRQLRRPDRRHRRRRLRLHAERDAGQRQHHLLRGNHAFKAGFDIQHVADTRTAAPQSSSTPSRTRPRTWRRETARTASATRPSRSTSASPTSTYTHEPLQRLRAGRLARVARTSRCSTACATTSTTCRTANAERAGRDLARVPTSTRTTSRRALGVVWTLGDDRAHRAARQHRHDVRPGAATRATSRRCRTTAPTRAPSATFTPTQAGAPAFPAVLSAGAGATPNTAVDGRSRLRGGARRGRTTCSSSARSATDYSASVGAIVRQGLQPAGRHQHQPDQPDRHAGRRPPDLQHRGQRRRRASIRATTRINRCSRSASRPTRT